MGHSADESTKTLRCSSECSLFWTCHNGRSNLGIGGGVTLARTQAPSGLKRKTTAG